MSEQQERLDEYTERLEALAVELGMDFYPVNFDLVPNNFMLEISVYGLPVRMRHWSFGVRYIHQLVRQHMGHSRIFEVMFPGDPCQAFMLEHNSLAENTLVTAHVLGHADFAKNNQLFVRFMSMAGSHILEQSAARAHRLELALAAHGQDRVEAVLDAALALEAHIDIDQPLHRPLFPQFVAPTHRSTCSATGTRSCRAKRRRQRARTSCSAARCRRGRNATCCGSSPTTAPTWTNGSATFSWRCARKPTTSTRSSPARS
jgi:stage V sporulation protein R